MALLSCAPSRSAADFDRLFNTLFDRNSGRAARAGRWTPSSTATTSCCAPTCPASLEDDVNIELNDGSLMISGERKCRAHAGGARLLPPRAPKSRSSGCTPTLPDGIDGEQNKAVQEWRARGLILKPSSRGAWPRQDPDRRRQARDDRGRSQREVAPRGAASTLRPCQRDIQDRRPRRLGPRGRPRDRARRGRTPAFVPLATTATVKGLDSAEVEALGFQMVLGNTFHLFIQPGHELIERPGRAARVHGAGGGPIITDSGGFQVFSMGHGSVAEEIKGSRTNERKSRILEIERGGRPLPLLPRRRRALHGAGDLDGDPGGARLGRRARVRRVHAVPRRPRLHGRVDRAHAPLARPLRVVAPRARPAGASCSTGSCRAACTRTCARVGGADRGGAGPRRGGRRLARAGEGADARGGGLGARPAPPRSRATCSGSATWTTSSRASPPASTPSTAPRPPGWPATAPRWCPTRRALAARPGEVALARGTRADRRGLPLPGLPRR